MLEEQFCATGETLGARNLEPQSVGDAVDQAEQSTNMHDLFHGCAANSRSS